jgi:1,4-alpha-glucan branching enzyme
MPGDRWNKAANLRALLAYMWAHPGKQLLFMGGELGQEREWSETRSLDWHLLDDPLHAGIHTLIGDLNRAYRTHPALWTNDTTPDGFSWIDANDATGNVLSFLRHGTTPDGNPTVLACVANFAGRPNEAYRIGLPFAGRWHEILNTDADTYGGSGVGNLGTVTAHAQPWHGRPASAVLRLPPAGVLWLVPETDQLAEPEVDPDVDAAPAAPVTDQAPLAAPPAPADDLPPAPQQAEESNSSQ